ncbi:GMC family oxidoreductase [Nocardioides sp. QY071]|uniref:GMC family oxidoreductase n=1 Tax=Nocardioides sp. QY071 TaxID=3044187 RepID=UPI00249C3FF5
MTENDWDLIVVGAGSAGAALAARAAAGGRRVLLLEGGPDYRSRDMPEVWRSPNPLRALLDPEATKSLVWRDLMATRTEHQEAQPYWRGRGVGGSSSVNGQIAIRPPLEDFDDYAALGADGWDRDSVLPYFARLEDDQDYGAAAYHGSGGPIPVFRTDPADWGSVDRALHDAALGAGFGWEDDVNAPGATGVSRYPINSRGGRRVTTNDAYLEPMRADPNLDIRGGVLVDRLLIDGDRVVGVTAVVDGVPAEFRADLTVLSAGAIHSPAILQRSGIGPADVLERAGVRVRADLAVGRALQDHPVVFVRIPLTEESAVTSVDGRHTNVTVRYTSEGPGSVFNDMLIMSGNQNVLAMERADVRFGAGAVGLWVNRVYAEGTVSIVSTDPRVQPFVRQRMLDDERDLARFRHGIRLVADLCRSDAVAAISAGNLPDLNAELFAAIDDDRRLDEFLLATAADAQHPTSTCRIGRGDDPRAVVDSSGRLHGFRGVMVADASVLPFVPRANTHLAAVMVGEHLADKLG